MVELCFFEEQFWEPERARVKVPDILGLMRGLAVFETVRTYNRRPFALGEHLERIEQSARRVKLYLPLSFEEISGIIDQGIDLLGEEALVQLFLIAGDSGPFLLILFSALPKLPAELYERGVKLLPVDFARPFPEVKVPCRLEGYLARLEDNEAFEVLYCPGGAMTEAETSNFFLVKEGMLVTAPANRVLPGITRGIVLELASRMGIPIEERCPRMEEIETAQEAFITGTVKEILPVVKVGTKVIGKGVPGSLTRELQIAYREEVQRRVKG
ncbi:MAG: Aminotransferase class IV [Acetothermia bacterium 64_32]|nr:MAG: Aminotransferase class IV [Acetothermia bacterium 64_32]HAF70976.1 aminotransferase IV [Candidatus Acetothermia bacterium]